MPLNPLVSAILSTIVDAIGEGLISESPEVPTVGIIRALPAEAKTGEMLPPWQGQVQIDGQSYRLSPGAQIRNELNMIVMPATVQAPVKVRYQTDPGGSLHRVWILSTAEASLPENR